ncbi:ribosomal RNA processing protein 1 homolog isoform X2 [Galleria mellonella]|uniref:Ribosomal RNA processing protein 1 homolog isoform X2 n=1 Tax=Galleria mellonella TaxID=7137 RepID=A0A6J3BW17_GALME|nr:ribosomal RNA processing protein 1 homolog isoform X2 [Galleria mellonella]
MKPLNKFKDKNVKKKKKLIIKPKKDQVLVVAQEIKFARLLSGNEKRTRDRVLKALKKWLSNCFEKSHVFKEDDFIRVWKGLFYAVWMSDKPLIQLVRRYLRGGLRCLHRTSWSLDSCEMFTKMLTGPDGIFAVKTPHYARNATSMLMHITDCFLEECAKVSGGNIPDASMVMLIRPFAEYMGFGETAVVNASCRRVLNALVRQSELGLEYQQATQAWKQMGCPQGGPEALEMVSDEDETLSGDEVESDNDGADKPLDPRAGHVDVVLASLPVPANMIADMLRSLLAKASSKAHKRIKICMQRFERLSQQEYPLPAEVPPSVEEPPLRPTVAAKNLLRHERQMVEEADELALRGLSRKQRRRLLARSRAGISIVDTEMTSDNATNDGWTVESTEPQSQNHDSSNKENVDKTKKNKRKLNNENKNDAKKQKTSNSKHNNGNIKQNEVVNNNKIKDNGKKDKNIKSNVEKNTKVIQNGVRKTDKSLPVKKKMHKEFGINKKENIKEVNSNNKKETTVNKDNNRNKSNIPNVKNKMKSDSKIENKNVTKKPTVVVNKVKNFQKQISPKDKRLESVLKKASYHTPKKVKFVLKNNSMQGTMDYYKSVRQSPSIPFDGSKKPSKTNLKPSTPSPINPFFKKKLKLKN